MSMLCFVHRLVSLVKPGWFIHINLVFHISEDGSEMVGLYAAALKNVIVQENFTINDNMHF